jgi:hypothetical protein
MTFVRGEENNTRGFTMLASKLKAEWVWIASFWKFNIILVKRTKNTWNGA